MDLHINQIMGHSIHLFKEKIESSSSSSQKAIVVVALIALGCLAAYLYYTMVMKAEPAKIKDKKIVPLEKAAKADKPAPKSSKEAPPIKQEKAKPKQASDKILFEDEILEEVEEEKILDSSDLESKGKKAQPEKPLKRVSTPASRQAREEADYLKALKLSMEEAGPDQLPNNLDADLEAALEVSKKEALSNGYVILEPGDDDDLQKIILQSEKEAKEKEDKELETARKLSKQEAVKKPPVKAPQTPAADPKKPVGKTPKKAETPVDEKLLETAKAKSDKCEESLKISVENAKEKNKKIRITGHEIKRNGVENAFLVLKFSSEVNRNLAVEELRNPPYSMFQKNEPTRIGTTELQLDVEQTIDFQDKF